MNLKKKTVQPEDLIVLSPVVFPSILSETLQNLKTTEKYVYELVEKSNCKGARFVYSKNGNRHELCFDNGANIKVDKNVWMYCPDKLPTIHLNY